MVGIMIKIKDENVGEVGEDYVSKPMIKKDTQILAIIGIAKKLAKYLKNEKMGN
ncbi:hypothetical protein Metig_0668 [Methanotorris igneus Kol 5]|uniref:Uncharacterized protein n=2 Tax=Methanotorris igneus TaxID=2189 RepID=F6BCK7_METIK|nr:hypothetical protein Metig_0668 [Methanotorris igneus Kol 5]